MELTLRADLPHNMTVRQAMYMMSKTVKNLGLQNKQEVHKLYKRREEGGRLCTGDSAACEGQSSGCRHFDTREGFKEVQTQLEYTGTIIREPNFALKCRKKTAADYAKQKASMTLDISPEKAEFILKEFPFSRARQRKVHAQTLFHNDETYAMIESHVERLRSRETTPSLHVLMRQISTAKPSQRTRIKVRKLLSAHLSQELQLPQTEFEIVTSEEE